MKPRHYLPNLAIDGGRATRDHTRLFRCGRALRQAQGYILGWALANLGIEVYAFCINVNHQHEVFGHPAGWDKPARYGQFFRDLHYHLSRLTKLDLRGVCDWTGPVYEPDKRSSAIPILDEESERRKVVYTMAQGVIDGMVERPEDFPGLNFLPHHLDETEVFERNEMIDKLDPGRLTFAEDSYSVRLEIPPHNRHHSRAEYRALIENELEELCAEIAAKREKTGERVPGRSAYFKTRFGRLQGAEDLAATRKKFSPPPPVAHCECPDRELAYREMRRNFFDSHHEASARHRAGDPHVVFPAGTYGWHAIASVPVESTPPLPWSMPPP